MIKGLDLLLGFFVILDEYKLDFKFVIRKLIVLSEEELE